MTSTATQACPEPTGGNDGQLWTDERIAEVIDSAQVVLYRTHYVNSEAVNWLMIRVRNDLLARLRTVEQERDELARIIRYIDDHAPRADDTCEEPGITLSQAARRALNAESEATNE